MIITETNVPHKDKALLTLAKAMTKRIWYQFSLPPLVLHAVQNRTLGTLCVGANLTLPSSNTTGLTSLPHDGIGLNHCGLAARKRNISAGRGCVTAGRALVNWKNNPDGTRSPYEMNVTYMDALSRRECSDEERCASLFSPMRFC